MNLKLLTSSLMLLSTLVSAEPERPVIDRTIHMAEGHVSGGENRHWLNPYAPPLTTTADSRIGLTHRPFRGVFFRLIKPENINQPFLESPAGMEIMHSADIYDDDYSGITNPSTEIPSRNSGGHMTICDPMGEFDELTGSTRPNPYVCGVNNADDCYDLTVISQTEGMRLASTHVHVRVSNPKTVNAEIVEITTGNTIESNVAFGGGVSFFEPTVTGDGHLMVSRTDAGNNSNISDIVYFTGDNVDNFAACDVRQFTRRENIGHAPYDSTINTRYGFAMQPFETLDNQGNVYVLPDNARFGTYPWIDKGGANITFSSLGGRISSAGFPTRCPPEVEAAYGGTCSANAENSPINGRTLMGLWTKGKMVLMDNMLNHMDHMEDVRETGHVDVRIYEPAGDPRDGYKRVGDSRSREIDIMPNGNVPNSSFFDSHEHRFNYHQSMTPITPADVTWLMSTGRSTDEVPFDDYLNVNGFIVSHMVQALRFNAQYNVRAALAGRLQNSATSPNWNKPTSARMEGDGRAEIVANGGIVGKGYWLDGDNISLEYDIPAQANPASVLNAPWYYGLFIDSRNNAGERALITFPDNSEIRLRGNNTIVFVNGGGNQVHTVTTPTAIPDTGWMHLGFQLSPGNQTVETYINGYEVDTYNSGTALFVLNQGVLSLGANNNINTSFTGWIDDFKVFSEVVNKEVACNLAKGTIAGVTNSAPANWRDLANAHDASTHNEVSNVVANPTSQYVCFHDYSDDYAAHLQNIPNGMIGYREEINFPEGPLFFDRPRPESRGNAFCLSCHTADGQAGLDLDALALDNNTMAPDDHRRQPLQPDPFVYGNIPANWLGQGIPAQAFDTDGSGFNLDYWLLDGGSESNPPTGITLSIADNTLNVGDTTTTNAVVAPANADNRTVTYTTSNAAVATVDNFGNITAVGAGSAVITASTVNNFTDSVTVTVSAVVEENPATGITLTIAATALTVGDTTNATAQVTPADADDVSVTYVSSGPAVATINANGLITAVAPGSTNITASTVNGLTDTVTVTVTAQSTGPSEPESLLLNPGFEDGAANWTINGGGITNVSHTGANAVLVNGNGGANQQIVLNPNTTYTFTVSGRVGAAGQQFYMGVTNVTTGTFIENALFTSTTYVDQSITFTTGANSDNYNLWMWNNQGGQYYADDFVLEVTGTVTPPNPAVSVTLVASATEILVAETSTLTATVNPTDADDTTVTFSSSDNSVATVAANGVVTAVSAGTTTITATTVNGLTDQVTITVTEPVVEPENLMVNPGFEDGQAPWTINGGALTNNNVRSGTTAALVNGNGGVNQQLVLQPNTEYTFSAWGRVGANGQSFYIGVTNLTTGTFIENAVVDSTSYMQQSITFTTGNSSDEYNLWMWNNQGGQYYVDDFSLVQGTQVTPPANPATQIDLVATVTTLTEGDTTTLQATISPADADDVSVTYSTNDESIATVNASGVVTAVSAGTATITASTVNGLTDSVVITVEAAQVTPPTGDPEQLVSASSYTADSGNWDANRLINVHDDDQVVEARGTTDGAGETAWIEYQFATASQFEFSVREDNAPSYQISRWKVQGYIDGQWVDMVDWVNANVNGWTDAIADDSLVTNRIRLIVEAPSGQRVGLREFDATGIVH